MNSSTLYNAGYDQEGADYLSGPVGHPTHPNAGRCRYTTVITRAPTDWMCPAIFSCLCCFWPLGLAAIFYASEANDRAQKNDLHGAERAGNRARNLIISSVLIGIIIITTIMALYLTHHFPAKNNIHMSP